ncbi:MAG: serine/threonine-protein kinase [Longibaculum sp.]
MEREERLKDFRSDELVGQGNYGKVYHLVQNGENQAVKVIDIYSQNSDFNEILGMNSQDELEDKTQKIMNEIDVLYKLKGNTHIVNYIDHYISKQKDKYSLYIKMEYLQSLNTFYSKDIDSKQAIGICYDVLDALSVCEDSHIVHGDIKPQNIMVDEDGHHKLTDFGISKILNNKTGVNDYTPAYAPPEVILERKYTEQSDLYSLGLVIYQMFNDCLLPFMKKDFQKKETQEIIEKRLNEELPQPSHGNKEMNAFLLKALDKDPKKRFQNAKEMKSELQKLEEENKIPSIMISLPVLIAIAVKFNHFSVYAKTPTPVVKKSLVQTIKSASITTKIIGAIVGALIVCSASYFGVQGVKNITHSTPHGEFAKENESLDAKTIYDNLVKKMNSEVTYYSWVMTNPYARYDNEIFKKNGKVAIIQRFIPNDEDVQYSIFADEKEYSMRMEEGSDIRNLNILDRDDASTNIMNSFYEIEGCEVKSLDKQVIDEKIVLTFKLYISTDQEPYSINSITIGDNGLIEKYESKIYEDAQYKNIKIIHTSIYSHYNEKTTSYLDEEIEKIKTYDGLTSEELAEKIKR